MFPLTPCRGLALLHRELQVATTVLPRADADFAAGALEVEVLEISSHATRDQGERNELCGLRRLRCPSISNSRTLENTCERDGATNGSRNRSNCTEKMEAPSGFEPEMEVLQTSALPLGDGAD